MVAVLCLSALAWSIDPNRPISQYIGDHWGSESGFPGGSVNAIAQTTDGYLWIGTDRGLVRFDGLNFRMYQHATPGTLAIGPVVGLVADSEGSLWIVLQSTKVLRYRDGKFEPGRDEAEFAITSVYKEPKGEFLLSSLVIGALRYNAGKFVTLTSPEQLPSSLVNTPLEPTSSAATRSNWSTGVETHRLAPPNSPVISMTESADGTVWLGTRDRGLFFVKDGRISSITGRLPDTKVNCILPLNDGELWIGTDKGVVHWNGNEITDKDVPSMLRHDQIQVLLRDHDSNIWVGTAQGLVRFNSGGLAVDSSSHASVTAIFEDREGNVWTGGPRGLERLRDSAFVTFLLADGLPSENNGPVYVDSEDRAWFAPLEGGLYWLKDGAVGKVTEGGLQQDVVYSISGNKNELWIGRQLGGLTHLRYNGGRLVSETYTQANGLAQNGVYAVHQSRDGTLWAGTLSGGVSALRNRRFTTYTTAEGLASNTVTTIAEGPDGKIWFGTPAGLNEFANGQWRVYTPRDGLPSPEVNCLLVDSDGVLWIGSSAGLAYLNSDRVQVPREPELLRGQILGIAEDRSGWLWIATSNHILRVNRSGLLKGDALGDSDVHEYGLSDGLRGVEGVKRHQSVVGDPLGRIWFSMNRGLSVVDPNRAAAASPPALVHVEAMSADGNPIDFRGPIRISSSRQRITFGYAGLSLSNSERVRYRYRLEGFDHGWSEAVTTRETIYTNLAPGRYAFRVMASNSDGLWNGAEATFPFEVQPMWWQTWWFRVSVLLLLGFFILLVYRLRMRQLTQQLNVRFEERLAERTRIAQDLHDTLLQGFLSASMQLHVADDQLSVASPAKPIVGRVLDLMGRVINDGRNAVRGLRLSSTESGDLEQALSRVPQELAIQQEVNFRLVVEGQVRPLHPLIRDEVYRISREALANAFRHSQANGIEVELEYADNQLRVVVRDNGCGIDPHVLSVGRDGHWGLPGMRERAERIGARLKVWSRAEGGTEVELSVPSHVAFPSYPFRRRGWLPWLHFARERGNSARKMQDHD